MRLPSTTTATTTTTSASTAEPTAASSASSTATTASSTESSATPRSTAATSTTATATTKSASSTPVAANATARTLSLGSLWCWGLGQEPADGQQLGWIDKELQNNFFFVFKKYLKNQIQDQLYLLQSIETARLQIVTQLNGHRIVAQRSEDLVDLADLFLVLQEDGRIEIWHIVDLYFAHQIILARIVHDAQRDHTLRRTSVEATTTAATETSATATESASSAATTLNGIINVSLKTSLYLLFISIYEFVSN